jgi:hypothetical protein
MRAAGKKMLKNTNIGIDSSAEADAHERRRHVRYPFTATVEAVEPKSQTRINGRTSDLSRGGCYVDTISSFPVGSIVRMRLTKETRSFEAPAEVVYSLVGMGMGVKFTDGDPEQLWILEKWVGELSGDLLPEPEPERPSDQSCAEGNPCNEGNDVLAELVMELMRQRVLSDAKCKAMLEKLKRIGRAKASSSHA